MVFPGEVTVVRNEGRKAITPALACEFAMQKEWYNPRALTVLANRRAIIEVKEDVLGKASCRLLSPRVPRLNQRTPVIVLVRATCARDTSTVTRLVCQLARNDLLNRSACAPQTVTTAVGLAGVA